MTTAAKADFRGECNRRRDQDLILVGNTFAIKDQIKAAGGIWDRDTKAWLVPDEQTLQDMTALLPATSSARRTGASAPATSAPASGTATDRQRNAIRRLAARLDRIDQFDSNWGTGRQEAQRLLTIANTPATTRKDASTAIERASGLIDDEM